MLATYICLNGSLLDQLSCTIVYLHNLFTCTFGRINMSVCLSVCLLGLYPVRPGGWVAVPRHVGRTYVPLLCGVHTDLRYYVIRDVIVLQILCFHW